MSRLIDADALIEFIDVGHLRHPSELCFSELDVVNMLNHAPIAYDVEKVVADLQALKTKYEKLQRVTEDKFEANELHIRCLQIDKDIEIVRKGGVE